MKRILLCCTVSVLLLSAAAGAEVKSKVSPPADSGAGAGVTVGDTTILPSGNRIIKSGTHTIYVQPEGASISNSTKGETPKYLENRKGEVVSVTSSEKARPAPRAPDPAKSGNSPSPVPAAPQRPSFSSLPQSPSHSSPTRR